jgi:hypothetical protein
MTVLEAVEGVLAGLDSFYALRGHSHPMLYRCIPVQIAALDDLVQFEKSRGVGRGCSSWPALLMLQCKNGCAIDVPKRVEVNLIARLGSADSRPRGSIVEVVKGM